MAKISVSLDDDLADALRKRGRGTVSGFVSDAVREALAREQMLDALAHLDRELGPVDPQLHAEVGALFAEVVAAGAPPKRRRRAAADRG